jgi:hypothetical protein
MCPWQITHGQVAEHQEAMSRAGGRCNLQLLEWLEPQVGTHRIGLRNLISSVGRRCRCLPRALALGAAAATTAAIPVPAAAAAAPPRRRTPVIAPPAPATAALAPAAAAAAAPLAIVPLPVPPALLPALATIVPPPPVIPVVPPPVIPAPVTAVPARERRGSKVLNERQGRQCSECGRACAQPRPLCMTSTAIWRKDIWRKRGTATQPQYSRPSPAPVPPVIVPLPAAAARPPVPAAAAAAGPAAGAPPLLVPRQLPFLTLGLPPPLLPAATITALWLHAHLPLLLLALRRCCSRSRLLQRIGLLLLLLLQTQGGRQAGMTPGRQAGGKAVSSCQQVLIVRQASRTAPLGPPSQLQGCRNPNPQQAC